MTASNDGHRYQCANPNCGKAFSKPKIIKYYVCPTCQTLVIMDTKVTQSNQEVKNKNDSATKENRTQRKRKQKPEALDRKQPEPTEPPQTSQPSETTKSILSTNLPDLEAPLTIQSSIVNASQSENAPDEPKKEETIDLEVPITAQSPVISDAPPETEMDESDETKTEDDVIRDYVKLATSPDLISPSVNENSETFGVEKKPIVGDSFCKHYFGYLGQREKGEQIPEDCFGCSKSIECMLESNEHSSKKVEGIKQWYLSQ